MSELQIQRLNRDGRPRRCQHCDQYAVVLFGARPWPLCRDHFTGIMRSLPPHQAIEAALALAEIEDEG